MISKFISLSIFLLFVAQAQSFEFDLNAKNLDDYSFGFLQAYGDTRFASQIKLCLLEGELAGLLEEGFSLLETKNPAQVAEGIKKIGSWFSIFYRAFVLCQAGTASVRDDILQLVLSFQNADSVSYVADESLLISGVEVLPYILFAIEAYEDERPIEIGLGIGAAMERVVHNRKQSLEI